MAGVALVAMAGLGRWSYGLPGDVSNEGIGTMVPFLAAAGGAVVGSVVGFLGALYIERRREATAARAEILAIVLEMGLLEDALTQAIEQGIQLREDLRRDMWDRYSTRLVNWVPWHLVSALHLHQQLFSTVREHYRTLATSFTEGQKLADMHTLLWTFVYQSQSLRTELQKSVKALEKSLWPKTPPGASPSKKEEQALVRLAADLNEGALRFVRSKGLDPQTEVPIRMTSIS